MKNIYWLLTIGIIIFCIYFSGLIIDYYSDDFQFVFYPSLPSNIFCFFFQKNPANTLAYRPVQALLMLGVQKYFGLNTLPIHLLNLTIHICLTYLVYIVMVNLQFSRLQAYLGSLFMAVSQINVHAVLSNDTFSQVLGTFAGCLCLFILYSNYLHPDSSKEHGNQKLYFTGLLLFGISLFSKETSVSFLGSIFIIIFIRYYKFGNMKIFTKRIIQSAFPFVIILLLYTIVRSLVVDVHPSFGPDRYQFNISANIIKNVVMYFIAAITPFSTVSLFTAFKMGNIVMISIFAFITTVFWTAVVYGLLNHNNRNIIILLGILAIISSLPVVLLNHVSELYVYNSMPFVAIIMGVGLGTLYERIRMRGLKRYLFISILLLFVMHITAIQGKASLMSYNGKRASELLEQVLPFVGRVPTGGNLFLLNPQSDEVKYSVFLINGFSFLDCGFYRIKQLSRRDDITIKIIETSNLKQIEKESNSLILKLDNEKVEVYKFANAK